MGSYQSVSLDTALQCNFCSNMTTSVTELYPHEAGGYCVFTARDKTLYACDACRLNTCAKCSQELPIYASKKCDTCGFTHCYNNTDMRLVGDKDDTIAPSGLVLCDACLCDTLISV